MKYRDVALIDSNYTLMLFCMLYPSKVDGALFIVSDGVSSKVRKRLKHCVYLTDTNYLKARKIRELIRNLKYILSPFFIRLRITKEIQFYGQDHAWFSFIGRNKPFILLEDGLDNYFKTPSSGLKRKIFSFFGFPYHEFGRSKNTTEIVLTGLKELPKDIIYKTKIIVLDDVWQKLTKKEKIKVKSLFFADKYSLKDLKQSNSVLILTQPLNQDRILSEADKINHYLEHISPGDIVFYKRHPRDTTDYTNLGWQELKYRDVPIELLLLCGLNFDKVITYNSTAICRFHNTEKVTIKK